MAAFEKIKRFFGDFAGGGESLVPAVGGSIVGVTDIAGAYGVNELERFYHEYADSEGVNINAMVANKLANIVCADAEIKVVCENEGGLLNEIAQSVERLGGIGGLRGAVAEAFGAGGVLFRPYVAGGRVYVDRIPQSRFWVLERCGSEITAGVFLAEIAEADNDCGGGFGRIKKVARFEAHRLDIATGRYVIENRAFTVGNGAKEAPLSCVDRWAEIEPVSVIEGVNKMLFGFLRSPVEIRGGLDGGYGADCGVNVPWEVYGAPVTYGQRTLIEMILEILEEIPLEYINKRAFIGADDLLFDSRERLPASGIYKLLRGTGGGGELGSFWEVFSPEIRHTSYFEGLNYLFGLLEKAISVNKGILTDLDSSDATATAIKRSTFDTYNLVDLMRKNVVRALDELVYACGVLLSEWEGGIDGGRNAGNRVSVEWSYALLEDSAETFGQLMECYREGIIGKDRVLSFMGISE